MKLLVNLYLVLAMLVLTTSIVKCEKFDFYYSKVVNNVRITHVGNYDSLNIIAAGEAGHPISSDVNTVIYKSTDGGSSWNTIYADSNETLPREKKFQRDLHRIKQISLDKILVFFEKGFIRRSSDAGNSWVLDSFGINRKLLDIEFIDERNGLLLWDTDSTSQNDEHVLTVTHNGGNTWSNIKISKDSLFDKGSNLVLEGISFIGKDSLVLNCDLRTYSSNSIFKSAYYLLFSDNLGMSWSKRLLYTSDSNNISDKRTYKIINSAFHFESMNIGYWMGATPNKSKPLFIDRPFELQFFKKTTNGGFNWDTFFHDTNTTSFVNTALEIIHIDEDDIIIRNNLPAAYIYRKGSNGYERIISNRFPGLVGHNGFDGTYDVTSLSSSKIMVASTFENVYFVNFKDPITYVKTPDNISNIKIYPNPVNVNINIKLNPKLLGVAQISILDINGAVFLTKETTFTSSTEYYQFISDKKLSSGSYFIQILYRNGVSEVQKFIVE